ncbi:hypothetical protein ACN47E_000270 [Coniothyrium glycines]
MASALKPCELALQVRTVATLKAVFPVRYHCGRDRQNTSTAHASGFPGRRINATSEEDWGPALTAIEGVAVVNLILDPVVNGRAAYKGRFPQACFRTDSLWQRCVSND